MTELERRRQLERLTKPELITKVIEAENARASAWSEGVVFAAIECGAIASPTEAFEAPGENPYRKEQS